MFQGSSRIAKYLHKSGPYTIVAFYITFGLLWIATSDYLVTLLFSDAVVLAKAQSIKGIFYVLITGLLLFILIRLYVKRLYSALLLAESCLAERRKAEKSLQKSNITLAAVISAAPVAIITLDLGGLITSWNRTAETIFGWRADEVNGISLTTILEESPHECMIHLQVLGSGTTIKDEEVVCRRKDGSSVEIAISAAPLVENGAVSGMMAVMADISLRKQAERALRESEQRYRNTMDACLAGILIIQDSRILYANSAMETLLGFQREELIGGSPYDLIAPEQRKLAHHMGSVRLAGEETKPYEVRHLRKDGSAIETLTWGKAIEFKGRSASVVTVIDITERKWASQSLRATIERLENEQAKTEAVIAALGAGVCIQDRDFRIIYQNDVMRQMVGDQLGEFCYKAHEGKDAVCDGCPLALTFEDGGVHWSEREAHVPNVHLKFAEVTTSALRNSSGTIIAGIEIVRDITKRKETDQAKRASEERLQRIFENSVLGIALSTLDGELVACNPAFERILGYNADELLGLRVSSVSYPDDTAHDMEMARSLIAGERQSYQIEKRYINKSGSIVWTTLTVSLIYDLNGQPTHALGLIEDITDKKAANEWLLLQQEELAAMAEQLSLAEERERRRIAQELHDHIGQALALARMKLDGCLDKPERLVQVKESLGSCIEDVRSLTFQLSPPLLYEVGLVAALRWLADTFAQKHDLNIAVLGGEQEPPLPEELRVTLFQIVRELLINVVKHSGATGANILVETSFDRFAITVQDDGKGIDWIPSSGPKGFGLFSIKQRLEHMGGLLQIGTSAEGGATVTVTVSLPEGSYPCQ